jgi:O-antigen/teichoic acid export membrane protein
MPSLTTRTLRMCSSSRRGHWRPSVRAVSANYATSLALVVVGALTGVLTARSLGATGKGQVAIAQSMVGTVTFFFSLSVEQAYVFMAGRSGSSRLMARAVRDGFVLGTAIGVFIAVAALFLRNVLPGGALIYELTGASVPFATSGLFAASVLQGRQDFRLWNILRFIPAVSYLVALVVMAAASQLTPIRATLCYVAATAFFWLITIGAVGTELVPLFRPHGYGAEARTTGTQELLHYGLRTHISALQNLLNQRADISVMAFFTTTAVVGRYSVAVSMVAPLSMIGPAVAAYLFPHMAARGGAASIATILKRVAVTTSAFAIVWAVVAPILLGPIFGKPFAGLDVTIALLCAAMVPLSLGYVLFAWWKGQDRPQRAAWAEGVAMLTMVSLLPPFVSRYGAAGAAAVSLATYTVSCLVAYLMYRYAIQRRQLRVASNE